MTELEKAFPPGLKWSIPYDTTHFVRTSITEVLITLAEAMVLVFIVVFLFLQNWRATIIPMLAVPVSLIGTFGAMLLFGFSINTLTLFGMVLAIGIVVDDAIVVLENVERIIASEHLSPRDATVKAMQQVTGPVIAIVFVLTAVFLPVAFLGGLVGEMYPAVRADDRRVGGDLGLRRADTDACAVRRAAARRARDGALDLRRGSTTGSRG